ncbi:hypothetical protein H310_12369 [Aphanomyces invadans]|uniref:Transmembrane protein n=1 Tax=Aphanomyces invadans TaxID=157072 RepID=A0A024TJM3_9STRA|nr:hypothetical protein H310_12369 [Aphanomyces invadans]ETV93806.1 hypothetical protein H310_12369 [Aphanomyces invadans]|eukprot:XP_008877615.1 hypothetical protein H310_12369 [Aphanomyces invadans]
MAQTSPFSPRGSGSRSSFTRTACFGDSARKYSSRIKPTLPIAYVSKWYRVVNNLSAGAGILVVGIVVVLLLYQGMFQSTNVTTYFQSTWIPHTQTCRWSSAGFVAVTGDVPWTAVCNWPLISMPTTPLSLSYYLSWGDNDALRWATFVFVMGDVWIRFLVISAVGPTLDGYSIGKTTGYATTVGRDKSHKVDNFMMRLVFQITMGIVLLVNKPVLTYDILGSLERRRVVLLALVGTFSPLYAYVIRYTFSTNGHHYWSFSLLLVALMMGMSWMCLLTCAQGMPVPWRTGRGTQKLTTRRGSANTTVSTRCQRCVTSLDHKNTISIGPKLLFCTPSLLVLLGFCIFYDDNRFQWPRDVNSLDFSSRDVRRHVRHQRVDRGDTAP